MNRKAIIISILAIMCLAVQGQVHYRLEGTIGDSTLNTRLQLYQHMSPMEMINAAIDTLTVVGGKLIPAVGTLSEPGTFNLVSITENGEEPEILSPVFIIEDGTINIHFNPQKDEYKGPETPLNKAFGDFVNGFFPLLHGDSVRQQRLDSLMRNELTHHNDDVIGMQALLVVFSHVDPTTVAPWLELMSPRVKSGDAWNTLKNILGSMGLDMESPAPDFIPAVGEKFVDFAAEYDGKTTRLSDYVGRGKFVVLDFWAPSCGPCRREFPDLIAVYEKYKDKGLEVVGVAAWDDPKSALLVIKADGVPYPQMINIPKSAIKAYNLQSVPHIILFAPDGTILARGLRGADLEALLQDILPD